MPPRHGPILCTPAHSIPIILQINGRQSERARNTNIQRSISTTGKTPTQTIIQGQNHISKLPAELMIEIAKLLSIRDIANLRLASRGWAPVGAELILRDGVEIRPQLKDMARLKKISRNEVMSRSVTSLTIYTGDVDMFSFLYALFFSSAPKADVLRRVYVAGKLKASTPVSAIIEFDSRICAFLVFLGLS